MQKEVILAVNSIVVGIWAGVLALLVFAVIKYRKELLSFGQKAKVFIQEVIAELRKSTWPTWIELRDSTVVVIIAVAGLAGFVFVADLIFTQIIKWVTG